MKNILILNQFSYQTFPVTKGMIKAKEEDLRQIGITKCFDVENQCVIDYAPEQE